MHTLLMTLARNKLLAFTSKECTRSVVHSLLVNVDNLSVASVEDSSLF